MIDGLVLFNPQQYRDDRGWFARLTSESELRNEGITERFVQMNLGNNSTRGTIRGLHFQYPPASEGKLIRCTRGAIFDVAVDLRPESSTYLQAEHFILSDVSMLYIPPRFAHGYQTLKDNTEVQYLLTQEWAPLLEGGLRYNDPALNIPWPSPVSAISQKDQDWSLISQGACARL